LRDFIRRTPFGSIKRDQDTFAHDRLIPRGKYFALVGVPVALDGINFAWDRPLEPGTMQPMHLVTDPSSASAALLLLPGAHPLHHHHQQQAQHLQQQQQQQQYFGQSQQFHPVLLTPPQSSAPSMPTQNTNGAQRQYSERERQIKRRTKTGSAM
jgi:hypothetical protein